MTSVGLQAAADVVMILQNSCKNRIVKLDRKTVCYLFDVGHFVVYIYSLQPSKVMFNVISTQLLLK